MALRTTTGIPIIPEVSDGSPEIEAILPAPRPEGVLDIRPEEQEEDVWCYAACAKMLIKSVKQEIFQQCQIVEEIKQGGCCENRTSPICIGMGVNRDAIGGIFTRHRIQFNPNINVILTFGQVKDEIDAGRPIEVCIKWDGMEDSRHVIVIYGWKDGAQEKVFINDPLTDAGFRRNVVRLADLLSWLDQGAWELTWRGLKKEGE